jgi:hypothetical protein
MRSLFILSLPRSYSSQTFHHARIALGLQSPIWTSDGEILNNDRSVLYRDHGEHSKGGLKFTTAAADPARFAQVAAFLDQIARPEGFIYKDVVQPFVTASWLAGRTELAVLKILPDPTHVAASCIARDWLYPGNAADDEGGPLRRVIQGILRAEQAILAAPGEALAFEALIGGDAALRAALQRLYPEFEVPALGYVTPEFQRYREAVLQRRRDPAYAMIARLVAELQSTGVETRR